MSATVEARGDQRAVLEAFRKALRQEAHNLRRSWVAEYPAFFWQQMYGRLCRDGHLSTGTALRAVFNAQPESGAQGGLWLLLRDSPAESAAVEVTLEGHLGYVWSCAYSRDGSRIVSGGDDVRVWDASTGASLQVLETGQGEVHSCMFSADGGRVMAGFGHSLGAWDVDTGTRLYAREFPSWVADCALSHDGRAIAVATKDGLVHVCDAASGDVRFTASHGDLLQSCAFSPDDTHFLSGGGTELRIWDSAAGDEVVSFRDDDGPVFGCGFTIKGDQVVWVGYQRIRMRDIRAGGDVISIEIPARD